MLEAADIDFRYVGRGSGVQNHWHIGPRGTSEGAALLTSPWQGCKPQLRPVKVHRPSMHSRTLKERLGKWDIGLHLKDCQAEH